MKTVIKSLQYHKLLQLLNQDFYIFLLFFKIDSTQISLAVGRNMLSNLATRPIFCKPDRAPIYQEAEVDYIIKDLYKNNIIRDSKIPCNIRLIIVPKRAGKLRLCLDYRPLNLITEKDRYPLPRIDEILDRLSDAKIFSTLDATSGYYQVEIEAIHRIFMEERALRI